MKRFNVFSVIIGICSTLLFLNCINPASGNGSDVGNPELTGRLIDGRTNTPAADAVVRIYPVYNSKMAKALGKIANNAAPLDSTTSDHNGAYTFDSLEQGVYSLDAKLVDGKDTLTMRHPAVVFVNSLNIGNDTLQPPGMIRGKVAVPKGESPRNITCYIPGTSYIAITNDTGGFRITGIPEGTYSLATTSMKFSDTTITGIKVAPNKETDAGIINLSLNRSKNEHDVYGVFDSTKNDIAIARIEARVSGDSIPVGTPLISRLDWRPDLNGYSGFIYVPENGIFWTVDIWVYDSFGHRIGASRVPVISRATGDIEVPKFNPFNSVPVISLQDTVVSINDTIRLNPVISMLADDSIVSMAWKIRDAKVFTLVSKADTVIVAPRDSGAVKCIFKVTDRFGNTKIDTVENSIVVDPPFVRIGNDTTIPARSKLTISAGVKQRFGSVERYTWRLAGDTAWVDSSTKNKKTIAFNDAGEQVLVCSGRDDDGNIGIDTMKVLVVTEIEGMLEFNTVLIEELSPYVVKNSLSIQQMATLTIEPGVIVRLDNNSEIHVFGTIEAIGSGSKPIEFGFTSSDTTGNSNGCMYTGTVWGNIRMKYCKIGCNVKDKNETPRDTTILDSCTFINNTLQLWSRHGLIRGCIFDGANVQIVGFGSAHDNDTSVIWWNIHNNRFFTTDKEYLSGLSIMQSERPMNVAISGNHFNGGKGLSAFGHSFIIDNVVENTVSYGILAAMHAGSNKIVNNKILNCAGPGIIIYGGNTSCDQYAPSIIRRNTVIGNGFGPTTAYYPYDNAGIIGCLACRVENVIDSNYIAKNNNGVIAGLSYSLTHNNIVDNYQFNFKLQFGSEEQPISAQNWWGTTDSAQIQAKIFDGHDNPNFYALPIDPIATDAIPGAGSSLKWP